MNQEQISKEYSNAALFTMPGCEGCRREHELRLHEAKAMLSSLCELTEKIEARDAEIVKLKLEIAKQDTFIALLRSSKVEADNRLHLDQLTEI